MQKLIDDACVNGRYGHDVDYLDSATFVSGHNKKQGFDSKVAMSIYSIPLEPPLEDNEQKWVAEYLAKNAPKSDESSLRNDVVRASPRGTLRLKLFRV